MNLSNFEKQIQSNAHVIVKFGTEYCQPCKVLEKSIENVLASNIDILFMSLDAEDEAELSSHFKIRSVPTLLFFRNGQMVDKSVGVISEENLITKIQTLQNG